MRSRSGSANALFSRWILRKQFTFLSCGPDRPDIFHIEMPPTPCSRMLRKNIQRWRDTSAFMTWVNLSTYYSDRVTTEINPSDPGVEGEDARRSITFYAWFVNRRSGSVRD